MSSLDAPTKIDRYAVYGEIASGGMATVHFGRLVGPAGFGRIVAIKQLHRHLARDPEFTTMLLDEARLAARLHHPNVVSTLDVVADGDRVCLIMEYVRGASLAALIKRTTERADKVDPKIAVAVMAGVLHGLHAAHEASDENGKPLGIVHRDVSPQNILVGADGVARLLDFGVAKAAGRAQTTREGQIKGKLSYMAPEQIGGKVVDRRTDVFAASVVLWELLTGERLFGGENEGAVLQNVMTKEATPPSARAKGLPAEIDEVVLQGLRREPSKRFATARAMAIALERTLPTATSSEVGEWVVDVAGEWLAERADQMAAIEAGRAATEGELRSEVRTVTAVTPMAAAARKRRRAGWVFGAGVVGVLGVGVAVGLVLGVGRGSADARGGGSASASGGGSASASGGGSASGSASPSGGANANALPTARDEPPLTITVSAAPLATAPPPRPSAKPKALPASCSPPYTIDANGFKKYKVECL